MNRILPNPEAVRQRSRRIQRRSDLVLDILGVCFGDGKRFCLC